MTIQKADELNRIEARCYVPTSWGTSILSEGDFIVVSQAGIVQTFTSAQLASLYEEGISIGKALSPELEVEEQAQLDPVAYRGDLGRGVDAYREFQEYCDRYRLDYVFSSYSPVSTADSSFPDFQVFVNATGREVLSFNAGDVVIGYSDGRMEVEQP